MRITSAWQDWLTEQEWEEKPTIDEENQASQTVFGYGSEDLSASCFVEIDEGQNRFKLFAYPRIKITADDRAKVLEVIADINCRQILGRLELMPDNTLRYYACIDVEDADISVALIGNVMADLGRQFKKHLPDLVANALQGEESASSSVACVACQAPLKGGEKFCPECGAAQQRQCANCKANLAPAAKFCPECGTPAK